MLYKIVLFITVLVLFSCKKSITPPQTETHELSKGILVLNEGLFQMNNASMTWIDLTSGSSNSQFFFQKANRELGDTGNDMKRYGGKIYVTVSVSSTIEVLDAFSGKSLKQIQMQHNGQAKQPRNMTCSHGFVWITCFDGFIDVLDTTSLQIIHRISVGRNPEELTISGNKLFVTNSGGLNAPYYDSTVSVIDLNLKTEIQRVKVGKNPGAIVADATGDIYVISRGNYSTIPARLHRFHRDSDQVEETFTFEATGLARFGDNLLITNFNQTTHDATLALFDPENESILQYHFLDLSQVNTLYGIYPNLEKQEIYLLDANYYTNEGFIHVYSTQGTYLKKWSVGLNPSALLYFNH